MLLPDVNVLVYAHRVDAPEHGAYATWLRDLVAGDAPLALSELVLAGFLRIVTNRRAFVDPTPPDTALQFVDELVNQPGCRLLRPGVAHWRIFHDLYRKTRATGPLIADLYHAALAIEHGCEWVTNDGDFARIPDVRWRHPLAVKAQR